MPVKKKGGKNNKRKKNITDDEVSQFLPTVDSSENQMYAIAEKMLGNRRLLLKCQDGKNRLGIIPGKFKGRRHWINVGMLVMINIRDYQDDKADVIYIYSSEDVKKLQRNGDLGDFDVEQRDTCGFEFDEQEKTDLDLLEIDTDEEIDLEDL